MESIKNITLNDKDDVGIDPMTNLPSNKFSKQILKSVIGEARANQVLTSISMSIIPNIKGNSIGGGIKDSKYPTSHF